MNGPSFLIVGAQKAGTTNLWSVLNQHPDIEMHPSKELHYFDRHINYPQHDWYRGQFLDNDKLTGEATPSYCFWPGAVERIHEFDPDIKLVMILRDPVKRAISQYWMEVHGGHEDLLGYRGLIPIEERMASHHAKDLQYSLYHHSYFLRGLYYLQLDNIYKYFPKDQVHVMLLEDYMADSKAELLTLERFLHVHHFRQYDVTPAMRKGDYDLAAAPERVFGGLENYYRHANSMLMVRYNLDLSEWIF